MRAEAAGDARLHRPGAGFPVDSRTLQSLFGLTPAESRLAAGLAAGQSLEDYAVAGGISPMTARAQLRTVFGKVGVHRQSELGDTAARGAREAHGRNTPRS